MTSLNNDVIELWCKMVSRFMILSSLSLISTYIFYRALELEQLNEKKPQLKPDQISQIVNDEIEVMMMSSRNNNNNNLYNKNNKQYKFILWLNYKEKDGMSKFSECEYSNCILTPNEDFMSRGRIDLFDVVIISVEAYKEDHKAQQLMKKFTKRNPNQIYIMRLHESPRPDIPISFVNRKYIPQHFFNWTWSYKTISDIYDPYGFKIQTQDLSVSAHHWK